MNLVNELKMKSNKAEDVKQAVINEIKSYFDNYLENDLENYLKRIIGEKEIKERKVFMMVSFWEYHSGCTTTNFRCGGCVWFNPINQEGWDSKNYKGIDLYTIDKEICNYLSNKLEQKMQELGFSVISKERKDSWLNYYTMHYYFGW